MMRSVFVAVVLSLAGCTTILGMDPSTVGGSAAPGGPGGTLVAPAKNGPERLVVHDSSIFWIERFENSDAATIMKVSRDGGSVTTLASLAWGASRLVADSKAIYWVNTTKTNVQGVPLSGGAPFTLTDDYGFDHGGYGLAIDSTNLYVTTGESVVKIAIADGTAVPIATGLIGPSEVVVDATNAYWVTDSEVMKAPLAGGTPTTLASKLPTPDSLVLGGDVLYWTSPSDGTVMSMHVGGGVPVAVAFAQDHPKAIAVDHTSVYWVNDGAAGNTIMKAPRSGGAAVTVLSGDSTPQFVAVDDTSLYWTDARETPAYPHGAVMKNAKK